MMEKDVASFTPPSGEGARGLLAKPYMSRGRWVGTDINWGAGCALTGEWDISKLL